jgi:hypothetical protein
MHVEMRDGATPCIPAMLGSFGAGADAISDVLELVAREPPSVKPAPPGPAAPGPAGLGLTAAVPRARTRSARQGRPCRAHDRYTRSLGHSRA